MRRGGETSTAPRTFDENFEGRGRGGTTFGFSLFGGHFGVFSLSLLWLWLYL